MKLFLRRRQCELAVLCGLIAAVILGMIRFDSACDDLRTNVLRLHVLANSDSAADQAVKLAVRDRILAETETLFLDCESTDDAEAIARASLDRITSAAERVLRDQGFAYRASAEVGDGYFETREYPGFTLPAGHYRSLTVRLGEAAGHNWWCVIFPAMCLPAATDADLSDCTSKEAALIAGHPQKYEMKFKTVEWYEALKNRILTPD